jgi:multidrug efflux system membrane fusion protein
VSKDELLFVIDPRQYQAKVDQAKAEVKAKKADFKLAHIEWEKAKYLLEKAAISELKFDEATAQQDIAKAAVGIAQANLETAQLNLDYTQVKSPIDGRVSRNLVDEGNLVGAGQKTELATVVNDDSVYAYFNLSEREFLPLLRNYPQREASATSEGKKGVNPYPAYLALSDETDYPHKGHIDYASTQVDPSTGTIQIRAIFPNPKGLILQGMFVRIRVPVATKESLLVPDLAIQADQAGRYVLVVNDKDVVEQRQVTTGQLVKQMRVIEKGVGEKDRVITNGLQRARPGSKVKPTKASPQPSKPAGAQKPKPDMTGPDKQHPKSQQPKK